jgi:hypothetical protein
VPTTGVPQLNPSINRSASIGGSAALASGAATRPFSCLSHKTKSLEQTEARFLFRTVPCTLHTHETHNAATQPKDVNSNDIQKASIESIQELSQKFPINGGTVPQGDFLHKL